MLRAYYIQKSSKWKKILILRDIPKYDSNIDLLMVITVYFCRHG